jgi:signal transduction histidine kinase
MKFINHSVNYILLFADPLVKEKNIPDQAELRMHAEIVGVVDFLIGKSSQDTMSFQWMGSEPGLYRDAPMDLNRSKEFRMAINDAITARYPASIGSSLKGKDNKEHPVLLLFNPVNSYDSERNTQQEIDSSAIVVSIVHLEKLLYPHEPEQVTESEFLASRFVDLSAIQPSIGTEISSAHYLKRFSPLFPGKSLLAIEILPKKDFFSILPNRKFILTALISLLTTILMTLFVRHIRNLEYDLKKRIAEQTAEIRGQLVALTEAKTQIEKSDQLKTAFLNNISHEIRTPLNGILGFSVMLMGEDLSRGEKEECLGMLQVSSDRLTSTINNYMDMAMLITGNMPVRTQLVHPDQLLLNVSAKYRTLCIRKKIAFQILNSEKNNDSEFFTDPDLLEKIISHLLDNAVKFTSTGRVTVGFIYQKDDIEFFIRDTGIGISREAQELIFNAFTQEDIKQRHAYGGNGLGLSIARESVLLLKGRLTLQSEKGLGSTFTVSVPLKNNEINQAL